jgi:hypothetical protein
MPKIIVTDLTEMHAGNYCAAGWDWEGRRMVRILTRFGGNWTQNYVARTQLWSRRILEFQTAVIPGGRSMPHASEDTYIDERHIASVARPENWKALLAQSTSVSIEAIFNGALQFNPARPVRKSPYIEPGVACGSLGAVKARAADFRFYEDAYYAERPKLRCMFSDGFARYDLPVVSQRLRARWRMIGVAEMNQRQGEFGDVHVRVGLARPWAQQNKCYLMLNSLYRA